MKKIALSLTLLFCGICAFSQIYVPVNPTVYGSNNKRVKADSVIAFPQKDTLKSTYDLSPQIFYRPADSTWWSWTKDRGFFKLVSGSIARGISKLGSPTYGLLKPNDSTYILDTSASSIIYVKNKDSIIQYVTPTQLDSLHNTLNLFYPLQGDNSDTSIHFRNDSLPKLEYAIALRDTSTWDNNTIIDKQFLNDRISIITSTGITRPELQDTAAAIRASFPTGGIWGSITGTLSSQTDLQTALNAKLTKTDTTVMLAPYITGLTVTTSGTIYPSSITATVSGKTLSLPLTLNSQSPYTVFRRGSGSGIPSFSSLDTNYFNNNWATYVRSVNQPVITKAPILTITHIAPDLYDTLAITQSGNLTDGYLSSIDWNRFNNTTDTSFRTIEADNLKTLNVYPFTTRKGLYLQNNTVSTLAVPSQFSPPAYFRNSYFFSGVAHTQWVRIYSANSGSTPVFNIDGSTDSTTWPNYVILSSTAATFPSSVNAASAILSTGITIAGLLNINNGHQSIFFGNASSLSYTNPFTKVEISDSLRGFLINRGSTLARMKLGTNPFTATITSPGTGYTGTTFNRLAIIGGSGTGGQISGTISGGVVTSITSFVASNGFAPGYGYKVGDVISASIPGGSGFTSRVDKLQGDTACGLLFTDTTLNRQFSWNCINHSWDALGQNSHSIFTPTTGGTITSNISADNIINPAGTIAALTITMPSSPNNNDKVYFKFTQAVTSITYSGGTVVGHGTATADQQFYLVYDLTDNKWY